MLHSMWRTVSKLRWLVLTLGILYLACMGAGVATYHAGPQSLLAWVQRQDERQYEQLWSVVGRWVEPLREGRLGTILTCTGFVFSVNTLGDLLNFTIPGIFVVPIAATLLVFGGWMQGIGLATIHGSSFLSVFLYLLMGSLEWATYVLASVAGVNIGLSVLSPRRQGVPSRRAAFGVALGDGARLYLLIVMMLAVQALMEVLYIRKILLMGGSGRPPLMPW